MLSAVQIHVNGRHHNLLPATTFSAVRGKLLLVQADGQDRRTALALALTGRMKPTSGSVALGHDDSIARLRRHSAVLDSPDVNEPERHLTVRSLVAEDLALVPRKFRDRTKPTAWLVRQGHTEILDKWVEELESGALLALLAELALANPEVDVLVVDSPDRHTSDEGQWLPYLQGLAAGAERDLAVIAVVGRIPDGWEGDAAYVGAEQEPSVPEPAPAPAAEPEPEPAADPAPPTAAIPAVEPALEPAVEPASTPGADRSDEEESH